MTDSPHYRDPHVSLDPVDTPEAAQKPRAPSEQLHHEHRDERCHVRLRLPFEVEFTKGERYEGVDLSMGGFSVRGAAATPGQRVTGSLLIPSGDTELVIPVEAECLRPAASNVGDSDPLAFKITHVEPGQRELLRRVIRAYLSGNHLSVDSLIQRQDAQTPRQRRTTSSAATSSKGSKAASSTGRYVVFFLALGILILVIAATIYRNFVLIEPSFAAVTAPRIDIRAPGSGILKAHHVSAGDRVEQDAYLTGVNNVNLQTDLVLAEASQQYNSQLIDNLKKSLEKSGTSKVSVANSTQPASGDTVTFDTASPAIAQARMEQFETARQFESSKVSALKARASMNEIYSPCDCVVAWALGSAGGTYIEEGDRIMTLIKTDDEDVMVEALVHMSDISRIAPHQQAYIALGNTSKPLRARVRSVALDIERQPRAGFPEWVRQQQNVASVLLVPETPLPAEMVGQPVDVRFSENAMLSATAEWVWQGGLTAWKAVERLFQSTPDNAEKVG